MPVDRIAQAGDRLEPLLDGLGAGGEHLRRRRSGLLRLVVRGIGVLKEDARLVRVEREDADARPGPDEQLGPVDRERPRERGMDALSDGLGRHRQPAGALGRLRVAHVEVRQQDQELVSTVAGDDVARAGDPHQALGDAAQQLVRRVVAEAAVHQAEALEVDVDKRDRDAAAACAGEGRLELVLERAARRQAGERVALSGDAASGEHRLAQEADESRRPLRPEASDRNLHRQPPAVAPGSDDASRCASRCPRRPPPGAPRACGAGARARRRGSAARRAHGPPPRRAPTRTWTRPPRSGR